MSFSLKPRSQSRQKSEFWWRSLTRLNLTVLGISLALLSFSTQPRVSLGQQNQLDRIQQLEQQWREANRQGDLQAERRLLKEITLAYSLSGAIGNQVEAYERLIQVAQKLEDYDTEAQAYQDLASVYLRLDQQENVAQTYQKLATRAEDQQDWGKAINARINVGIAQRKLQDYSASVSSLQQAWAQAQQHTGPEFLNLQYQAQTFLALTYTLMGEMDQAIALHRQTLTFVQQNAEVLQQLPPVGKEASTLRGLARAYALQGEFDQALASIQKSLALISRDYPGFWEAQVLEEQGYILFKSGRLAEAEAALRQANQLYQAQWERTARSLRQVQSSSTVDLQTFNIGSYNLGIDAQRFLEQVLIAQNRPEEALLASEAGRTQAFLNVLATRRSPTEAPAVTLPNLDQLRQVAQAQKSTLVQYSVIYGNAFEYKVKFGLPQVIPAQLYIWVIQPNGQIHFRQVDVEADQLGLPLDQVVVNAREEIGVGGRGLTFQEDTAAVDRATRQIQDADYRVPEFSQLHRLLIAPIADLLPTDPNDRVTFIPQDFLFLVPFAALQDEQGQYLIQKHTILTAPSIQTLAFTQAQKQRNQGKASNVLVVGNPEMPSLQLQLDADPQQLSSLPGAGEEARAIAELLDNTQLLTGSEATKATVTRQMPQARIIHLATHGLLDKIGGFQSAMALAPGRENNGLLTAAEIVNLQLNAELVVLSACDTGRGAISGDGVVGLSRAFLAAGTPSVVVSLWKVPDAPTSTLMVEFYRNLQDDGQGDVAVALRKAMLATLEQYPDPRDWAAFILVGEP